jgi:iron complex transport system permease protein
MRKLNELQDYNQKIRSGEEAGFVPALLTRRKTHSGSLLFQTRRRRITLLVLSLGILLVTLLGCVTFGSVAVTPLTTLKIAWNHTLGILWSLPVDYTTGSDTIIWQIRLPRLVLASCVGAGLAGSGAIYQGLFRNPLADPYLVGVAQGAALGAVLVIVLPLPVFLYSAGAMQWGAFLGAILAVAIVYNLARIGGEVRTATLLLAGVAVGSIGAAITTLLTYIHNDKLSTIYGWLLGGFNTAGSWDNVWLIVPYLAIGILISMFCGRWLNVLQMGEDRAAQLGLNVALLKLALVVAATLMAGAAVSVSGLIGFVGLVVPHFIRILTGQDYRLLLPLSALWGAIFMVLCDSLSRTVLSPAELPVSVVTAFCGGPFFIYLMRRKKRVEGME